MLGGHSGLDPPLPISNRAVKRTSADDSMLFACESRSLPSYLLGELTAKLLLHKNPLCVNSGGFLLRSGCPACVGGDDTYRKYCYDESFILATSTLVY